jgi:hypothetical protein
LYAQILFHLKWELQGIFLKRMWGRCLFLCHKYQWCIWPLDSWFCKNKTRLLWEILVFDCLNILILFARLQFYIICSIIQMMYVKCRTKIPRIIYTNSCKFWFILAKQYQRKRSHYEMLMMNNWNHVVAKAHFNLSVRWAKK